MQQMKLLNRMKGLGIAVLLVLVGFENAMAQDKVSKEELVEVIAASINQLNIDELKLHLSEDFQISGRVPPISVKILEQLVGQLNEQVEEYSFTKLRRIRVVLKRISTVLFTADLENVRFLLA